MKAPFSLCFDVVCSSQGMNHSSEAVFPIHVYILLHVYLCGYFRKIYFKNIKHRYAYVSTKQNNVFNI